VVCLAALTSIRANETPEHSSPDFADVFCGSPIPLFQPMVTRPAVEGTAIIDVSITSFAFTPPNLTINVGDTVRWTDNGGTHTTTSDTGVWNSGSLSPGQMFSFTFNTTGTFPYHCAFHTF